MFQRLGEKKRYYYSGSSRHAPFSREGQHQHDPTHYNHIRTSTKPSMLISSASSLVSSTRDSRPSRYDPNNVSKLHPNKTGSRYNPDSSVPSMSKKNAFEVISRYSGSSLNGHSRYNSQTNRPPSTAPISSTSGSYHTYNNYMAQYGPAPRSKRSVDSKDVCDNIPGSSGYMSRAGKLRDLSINSSSANTTIQQSDYDSGSTLICSSLLKPYRRTNSAGNNISKHYRGQGYTNKYTCQGRYGTGIDTDGRYENSNSGKNFDKQPLTVSSLINSVPMTTRSVEKKVSHESKRIGLQPGDGFMLEDSDNESTRTIESRNLSRNEIDCQKDPNETKNIDSGNSQSSEYLSTPSEISWKRTVDEDKQNEDAFNNISGTLNGRQERKDYKLYLELEDDLKETSHSVINKSEPEDYDENIEKCNIIIDAHDDPLMRGPHVPNSLPRPEAYPEPIVPIKECIFPMKETEMKLWLLKNLPRNVRISKQKYLLKNPIKSLSEYPFISQNKIFHAQAASPILLTSLSKLKHYGNQRTALLKSTFLRLQKDWLSKCETMDKISERVRSDEIEEKKRKEAEAHKQEEKRQRQLQVQQGHGFSRRINRADFVDDAEIESVLLQIDPDYKHHQLAATITPMIIDPVKRHSIRFKDVNNLVTDKDAWASRFLTDAVDNFSSKEHKLFVEAYLIYPKKFGKIANYMGGLRTPEECVMHYYRTKKEIKYKTLIMEKNKRRKSRNSRRRKEKEKEHSKQVEDSPELKNELKVIKQKQGFEKNKIVMEQVEIKLDPIEANGTFSLDQKHGCEIFDDMNVTNGHATEDEADSILVSNKDSDVNMDLEVSALPKKRSISESHKEVDLNNFSEPFVQYKNKANTVQIETQPPQTSNKNESMLEDTDDYSDAVKKKHKQNDNHHRSSYWSVKENDMFPILLKKYGSQWNLISDKLGTKSTTMVRNYYQRKAIYKGWQSLLEEGDANYSCTKKIEKAKEESFTDSSVEPSNIDDISAQHAPALGIFNINRSTFNIQNATADDMPSQQTVSTQGLPQQHLPSIQLHDLPSQKIKHLQLSEPLTSAQSQNSKSIQTQQQQSIRFHSGIQHQEPQSIDISRRSSIRSLLNNNESISRNSLTPDSHNQEKLAHNVTTQDLPYMSHNSSRATPVGFGSPIISHQTFPKSAAAIHSCDPITSITNYTQKTDVHNHTKDDSSILHQRYRMPHTFHYLSANEQRMDSMVLPPILPSVSPVQQQTQPFIAATSYIPIYNFASDPLAALAAVASAPEALGLLSDNTVTHKTVDKRESDNASPNN